jgi:4-carboxymuconolactone decarboxylase
MSDSGEFSERLPVLEELVSMTVESMERSGLDADTYLKVRIAALAAMGAPPGSWMVNLAAAGEAGLSIADVQAILVAVAPVIGSARTMAAGGNALRALGLAAAGADSFEGEQ